MYNKGNRGNYQQAQRRSSTSGTPGADNDTDASSDNGPNLRPMQWYRGRGRGGPPGNRGNRGNRGSRGRGNQGDRQQLQIACSSSDIQSDIDALNLYTGSLLDERNSQMNSLNSDMDTDVSSEDGQSGRRTKKQNKPAAVSKMSDIQGDGGNGQQMQKKPSDCLTSAVKDKDANGEPNRWRPRPPKGKQLELQNLACNKLEQLPQ